MMVRNDEYWMGVALREAGKAAARSEVPIGAIIVKDGKVLSRAYNQREVAQDPAAHAELLAIRKAAKKLENWRLTGTTLYVTLEPCLMCMGAILLARIEKVVFGCHDPKGGAAGSLYDLSNDSRLNHRVELVAGVKGVECATMLSNFFAALRAQKKEAKQQNGELSECLFPTVLSDSGGPR